MHNRFKGIKSKKTSPKTKKEVHVPESVLLERQSEPLFEVNTLCKLGTSRKYGHKTQRGA